MCQETLCFPTQKLRLKVRLRATCCFAIETAVRGCEGRRCQTAVAAMLAYGRLSSDRSSIGKCNRRWLNAL